MTAAEKQAKFAELRQRFSAGTITDAQLRDEIQKMSDDVTPSEMLFDEFGNPNIANWPIPPSISTQPEVKPADSMDSLIEFVKFGAPAAAPPGTQGTGIPGISGVDAPLGAVPNPLAFGVTPDLSTLGVRDPFGAYTATRSRGVPVYDPTMGSMAGYQSALGMGYQPERGRFFLSPATQGTGSWAEYLANPMRQQQGVQNYGQSFGQLAQMIADPLGFEASNPLSGRFAQFFDPNSVRSDHIAQNLADAALASMGGPRSFNPALRDMFTRRFAAMSMSDPTINRQQSLANYADWLNRGLGGAALSPRTYGSNMYAGTPYVDPTVPSIGIPAAPSASPGIPLYEAPDATSMFNPMATDTPNLTFVNQPATSVSTPVPTPVPAPVPAPVQPSQPAGVPLTPEVFSGLPSDEQFGVMTGIGGWLGQFDKATQDALRATGKLDFMNTGVM